MKQGLYLETSVIGAYLDNGEPFRRDLTIRWWEHEMPDERTVISPLVASELGRLKEPHRSSYLKLISNLERSILLKKRPYLRKATSRAVFFIASTLPMHCTWRLLRFTRSIIW